VTTLATVLAVNAAAYTTAATPAVGTINSYNASSSVLNPTLPQLVNLNVGATLVVEKNYADTTTNSVTFSCFPPPIAAPTGLAVTGSTTGGTLTAGSYYWVITAVNTNESANSNEVSATLTGTTASASLTWTAVTGATGYKIYRGTTGGGENILVTTITSGSTVTYTDIGSGTSATPPGYTGDTFDDSTISLAIWQPGEKRTLQVVQPTSSGSKYWKVVQSVLVPVVVTGKTFTVNNSLTLSGVDGTSFNFPSTSDTVTTITNTQTLTNKRVTRRVGSVASTANPTFSTDNYDTYKVTALATGITSWTISGTPVDRDELTITIKDNGTAQNLSWYTPGSIDFVSSGVAGLPNVTSAGRKMTLKFVYDVDISGWVLMAADINGY